MCNSSTCINFLNLNYTFDEMAIYVTTNNNIIYIRCSISRIRPIGVLVTLNFHHLILQWKQHEKEHQEFICK